MPTTYQLGLNVSTERARLRLGSNRLRGLYQEDDVYRWSRDLLDFDPKRARVLTGYWANTFSRSDGDEKLPFAACMNYPNSVTDLLITAPALGDVPLQIANQFLPGVPLPVLSSVLPISGPFSLTVGNSDIILPSNSKINRSRQVMSHEYGHYLFCSLLFRHNRAAVDNLIWDTIARGEDLRTGVRAANEAMADFFTGQVAGAADYGWTDDAPAGDGVCAPPRNPSDPACFEENQTGVAVGATDEETIGRLVTMIHDAFDGQNAARGAARVPNDADSWTYSSPPTFDPITGQLLSGLPLIYSTVSWGSTDQNLERVALPSFALDDFAREVSDGLNLFGTGEDITERKVYRALNQAMVKGLAAVPLFASSGSRVVDTWCDRCRVLGLHAPNATITPSTTVRDLFDLCVSSPLVADAVGPPSVPDLRYDADRCTPCADDETSDANGVCQACSLIVVNNTCTACPADVVLNGSTMGPVTSLPATATTPGDPCPDLFVVRIDNPTALFTRGAPALRASVFVRPGILCPAEHRLWTVTNPLSYGAPQVSRGSSAGGSDGGGVVTLCNNLPQSTLTPSSGLGTSVTFITDAGGGGARSLLFNASVPGQVN